MCSAHSPVASGPRTATVVTRSQSVRWISIQPTSPSKSPTYGAQALIVKNGLLGTGVTVGLAGCGTEPTSMVNARVCSVEAYAVLKPSVVQIWKCAV